MFRFACLGLAILIVAGCSAAPSGPNPQVVMETSLGTVTIELFQSRAPITVKNFLGYVDDKFYDGTIFHRVMPNFMIQGGGMTPGLREKPTRGGIQNESSNGLSNERGTLAMARSDEANSATAQFFINVVDNGGLDRAHDGVGYAVFGRVIDGMDVVDRIRVVTTRDIGRHEGVPVNDILIKSIRRVELPPVRPSDGKTEPPKKPDKSS